MKAVFKVRTNPGSEPPIIVPLTLEWTQANGDHRVTLTGDAGTKTLYEGRALTTAKNTYESVRKQYVDRAKAEGWW